MRRSSSLVCQMILQGETVWIIRLLNSFLSLHMMSIFAGQGIRCNMGCQDMMQRGGPPVYFAWWVSSARLSVEFKVFSCLNWPQMLPETIVQSQSIDHPRFFTAFVTLFVKQYTINTYRLTVTNHYYIVTLPQENYHQASTYIMLTLPWLIMIMFSR